MVCGVSECVSCGKEKGKKQQLSKDTINAKVKMTRWLKTLKFLHGHATLCGHCIGFGSLPLLYIPTLICNTWCKGASPNESKLIVFNPIGHWIAKVVSF